MSTDTDQKRKALLQAYPGYSWHEKVAGWPPEQVVAVFLRFERDGWPKTEPKLNPEVKPAEITPDDPPEPPGDDQLPLF